MKPLVIALAVLGLSCGNESSNDANPPSSENLPSDPGIANNDEAFSLGSIPEGYNSWEAIDAADPEQTSQLILDGVDPTGADCSIYIMGTTRNSEAQKQLIVRSSFSHGGEGHPLYIVPILESENRKLVGRNIDAPGEIAIEFDGAMEARNIRTANIKWWHIDHFDVNRCTELTPRSTPGSEPTVPDASLTLAPGLQDLTQIDRVDPMTTQLKMWVGYDPKKRAFGEEDSCYIYLMAIDVRPELGSPLYYLRSSFNHDGRSHLAFSLSYRPEDAADGMFVAKLSSDAESFFKAEFADISQFASFEIATVKWLHSDHYHVDECRELSPIEA